MRIQLTGRRGERTVRRKVAIAAMAIGVVLFGIAVAPGVASAHFFGYSFGCTGLEWSATQYDSNVTNSIVVKVDDVVVYSNANFGASDVGSVPWTETVDHTFSIAVDAPGAEFDQNVFGTQKACNPPPSSSSTTSTTSTTTTTTTTQPPCLDCTPDTNVTVPTTTTTVAGSTTTTQPATTTTVEQAGPTTTASVGQQGPTSSVDQSSGAATTVAVGGSLPATGNSSTSLIVIALTLIGVGAVMLRLTSRPTR